MPNKRKYDYLKDYPVTFFLRISPVLKNELLQLLSKKEINDLLTTFLTNYVENNRK
jgi:hypothetical protein